MISKSNRTKPMKGFIGATQKTPNSPFKFCARTAKMFPNGDESMFITPSDLEELKNYKNGIKN